MPKGSCRTFGTSLAAFVTSRWCKCAIASTIRVTADVEEWKLSWPNKTLYTLCLCLGVFLTSCGSPKSEIDTIASPTDPTPIKDSPDTVVPPPVPTPDPRLPDLTGAVPINLIDNINYTGLAELAENVFPPLVGDAKIRLQFTNTRAQNINGNVLIAFEDNQGFWGAELTSFPGTSVHATTTLDAIFADEQIVIRTMGTLSGDDLNGTIFYRNRQPNDTACIQTQFTCDEMIYRNGSWIRHSYTEPPFPIGCQLTVADTVTPCRTYMNPTNTQVKRLGSFRGKYSNFAVLPEGR